MLSATSSRTSEQAPPRNYCHALGISPDEVRSSHLVGLRDALEAECMTKHPRMVIKHTIAMWNQFGRTVPGWPKAILASPFTSEPDTMLLDRFPAEFRADVSRWTERMTKPNPLDPEAPVRPLRPLTVASYVVFFRRFASALARRGILPIDESTASRCSSKATTSSKGCGTSCRPTPSPGTRGPQWRFGSRASSVMFRITMFASMPPGSRTST